MRAFVRFTGLMLGHFMFDHMAAAADYLQTEKRQRPNTNVMFADAVIGRPLVLAARYRERQLL